MSIYDIDKFAKT